MPTYSEQNRRHNPAAIVHCFITLGLNTATIVSLIDVFIQHSGQVVDRRFKTSLGVGCIFFEGMSGLPSIIHVGFLLEHISMSRVDCLLGKGKA
jgi:hypothetical protein